MSLIGQIYFNLYSFLCGKHPIHYLWHFQWLAHYYINRDLKKMLKKYGGIVLDVGCGEKPYKKLFGNVKKYIGIDIVEGKNVDFIISPNQRYPFEDNSIDTILCSQVLEHVDNEVFVLNEVKRVLKSGGMLILLVPFLYNEHGAPFDYRRFTVHNIKKMVSDYFDDINIYKQGGIGSTLTILFLNWCESLSNLNLFTKTIKILLLPIWILMVFVLNIIGFAFDRIDICNGFYNNILLIAKKR